MITGRVTDAPEAVVPLRVRGPAGDEAAIDAVLDTGFTHYLTLPPATIRRLKLLKMDTLECEMADGRIIPMESFLAVVVWDGKPRDARRGLGWCGHHRSKAVTFRRERHNESGRR